MDLHIDLCCLVTLLDGKRLSSIAIDGVLAELAVLSSEMQFDVV